MQNPADTPYGLLFMFDPDYADLIDQEHSFEQKMMRAREAQKLYVPEQTCWQ
jgi:hypothetical protein